MPLPTQPSTRPDPTRSGAVWVTGTGAFLLLAAAAVFTAIRWDQIPDAAKLGALMAATGAGLLAGRRLRTSLPATASTLFHLGTFLVPVDVAAIALHRDLDWGAVLLAEGLVATITFAWASAIEQSVVLRWGFRASVVVLAGGVAATTAVPAPMALAAAAAVALLLDRETDALSWAVLAGAAPLLGSLDSLATGSGTMARLGLVGDPSRAIAALSGFGAAAVLATIAHRRRDLRLAITSLVVCGLGIVSSWTGTDFTGGVDGLALAVGFLVIELVALLATDDPFWKRATATVALAAEVPAAVTVAVAGLLAAGTPLLETDTDRIAALTLAALGAGWLAAALRRQGPATPAVVALATSCAGAAALATGGGTVYAALLLVIAAVPVVVGHRAAGLIAPPAALLAALSTLDARTVDAAAGCASAAVAFVGGLIVAEAAVRRSRRADGADATLAELSTIALALAAFVPGTVVVGWLYWHEAAPALLLSSATIGATLLAAWLDRAELGLGDLDLGTIGRAVALWPVVVAIAEPEPRIAGVVALVAVGCSTVDALRLREPLVALGAAVTLPVAVVALSQTAGLSEARSGVAAAVAAVVLAGVGSSAGRRWLVPFAGAAGMAAGVGLSLSAQEPTALADTLILLGGLAMATSVERHRMEGVYLSGIVVTAGIWLRLAEAGATALEPYLVPVTAMLLLAGARARREGVGSWVAYGPAIGLFSGAALVERLGGGAGWHALVAGAVGIVAVVLGGQRRLAAPLFLGTAILVVLAGYETLAITAGFPTWVWLGLGGSVLLGAGSAMERHEVGPIETGRRLVDVVHEKYA